MTIPAVMSIEMAAGALDTRFTDPATELDGVLDYRALKELDCFGRSRANELVKTLLHGPCPSAMHPWFQAGYLLGLETARVLLAGNPAAVKAGVSL